MTGNIQQTQDSRDNKHMGRRGRGLPLHNDPPSEKSFDDLTGQEVRAEFARLLQRRMVANEMTQSELARASAKFLSGGRDIRDLVSKYVRGLALPNPVTLHALAKALGCESSDLLPSRGIPRAGDAHPTFDMRVSGDRVWLRVNQAVDYDTALEIAKLLKKQ